MNIKGQGHSLTFVQGHSDWTFSNFFSLETARPIETKFHVEPPWDGVMKVNTNGLCRITKMAAMESSIWLVAPNLTNEIYYAVVYVLDKKKTKQKKKKTNIRLFFRFYVSWVQILIHLTFGFPSSISETYCRFFSVSNSLKVVVKCVFEKVSLFVNS